MLRIGKKAQEIKERYLKLIDEDAEAFDKFMAALKLPKKTEEEKKIRAMEIEKATKVAIEVPLKTLRLTRELMEMAEELAEKGNKNALSDAGVACMAAYTSAHSAYLNVIINLSGLNDEDYRKEIMEEVREIMDEMEEKKSIIMKKVVEKIS